MNDMSVYSNQKMTYWQAWFHFWIKSFPSGNFTRDGIKSTFYYSEGKRKLRVIIHFSVWLGMTFLFLSILIPNYVNAQSPPQYYPGGYAPIGGGPPASGNPYSTPNYNSPPGSNGPINGSSPQYYPGGYAPLGAPQSECARFLADKKRDDLHGSMNVVSQPMAPPPECSTPASFPDTFCEVGALITIVGSAGVAYVSSGWASAWAWVTGSGAFVAYWGCE